jgi:hypothetical protein
MDPPPAWIESERIAWISAPSGIGIDNVAMQQVYDRWNAESIDSITKLLRVANTWPMHDLLTELKLYRARRSKNAASAPGAPAVVAPAVAVSTMSAPAASAVPAVNKPPKRTREDTKPHVVISQLDDDTMIELGDDDVPTAAPPVSAVPPNKKPKAAAAGGNKRPLAKTIGVAVADLMYGPPCPYYSDRRIDELKKAFAGLAPRAGAQVNLAGSASGSAAQPSSRGLAEDRARLAAVLAGMRELAVSAPVESIQPHIERINAMFFAIAREVDFHKQLLKYRDDRDRPPSGVSMALFNAIDKTIVAWNAFVGSFRVVDRAFTARGEQVLACLKRVMVSWDDLCATIDLLSAALDDTSCCLRALVVAGEARLTPLVQTSPSVDDVFSMFLDRQVIGDDVRAVCIWYVDTGIKTRAQDSGMSASLVTLERLFRL